jgi:hypothetical protein
MFLAKSTKNGNFKEGNKRIDLAFNYKDASSSKKSDKSKYQFCSEDLISNSSIDK